VLVPVRFNDLPTAYPYTLMISQATTESVLLQRLTELGGSVLRPRTVVRLKQDADGVDAIFDDGQVLRARYVVGADGMHSLVREEAGIGFTGAAYRESFVLADVQLSAGAPRDEVVLYFSPAGLVVVAPLPAGVHRVVATVQEAPEQPDARVVQALLDERGAERCPVRVSRLVWSSRFRVHHRVADRYRAGRIVLAGDAAHVHSPAGGQGMNTGIQDGIALADALIAALDGGGDAALDRYGAQRRPIAQDVVELADRLTRLATARQSLRPLRNLVLRALACLPAFRRKLALQLSGLAS